MEENWSRREIEKLQAENITVVRQLYSAFAQQNMTALLDVLSPEIDWLFYGPKAIPFAGHYRGHQEVESFFAQALGSCDFLLFEPREFVAGSNTVLVQGFERMRAKATQRTWETEWAHVFTLSANKIVKLREYYDTSVIVAAFSSP